MRRTGYPSSRHTCPCGTGPGNVASAGTDQSRPVYDPGLTLEPGPLTFRVVTDSRTPLRTTSLAARVLRQGGLVLRLVFALTLLVQVMGGVAAPAMHARVAPPMAAHVDQPGTAHLSHDEASCAACVATHGFARVERRVVELPAVLVAVIAATAYDERTVSRRVDAASSPRAPPSIA